MPSDSDLIQAFRSGQATAFETLYRRYARPAFLYARSLAGCQGVAEEAVQEAFLAIIRNIKGLRPGGSFRAYLFAGIRSRVIDASRRQATRRESRGPEPIELLARTRDAVSETSGLRERVEEALLALPETQREVIILKIFNELTFREIAAALQLSPNTVASRYRYGCAKLRRHLEGIVTDERIA